MLIRDLKANCVSLVYVYVIALTMFRIDMTYIVYITGRELKTYG